MLIDGLIINTLNEIIISRCRFVHVFDLDKDNISLALLQISQVGNVPFPRESLTFPLE